jgi:deazaflavin-dependent oxidoreductase (nitroreductase family)
VTALSHPESALKLSPPAPRFGGILWHIFGASNRLMASMAGKRWNPVFASIEHRGRRSGRLYRAPVAARRVEDGFVISLAFGAQVDWHRNLVAGSGGEIRWRDRTYLVGAPERIEAARALAAFHPVQRFFLRLGRIDGYIRLPDVPAQ